MSYMEIEIDGLKKHERRIYAPGQRVSGCLHLTEYGKPREIAYATITFSGQAQMKGEGPGRGSVLRNQEIRDVEVPFFSHRCALGVPTFKDNGKREGSTSSWPFEFRFPANRGFMGGVTEEPLPSDVEVYFNSSIGWYNDFAFSIFYKLEARAERASGLMREVPPVTRHLGLRPAHSGPFPQPEMQQIMCPLTGWKSDGLRQVQISTKQRLRGVFGRGTEHQKPSVVFQVYLTLPTLLFIGQESLLSISLQHCLQGPTDPPSPTLILQKTLFRLQTSVTGPGESCIIRDGSGFGIESNAPLPLDCQPVYLLSDFGLQKFTRRDNFIPDFELDIPQISYRSRIKVDITIEHAETGHIFETTCLCPVKVLPRPQAWILPENVGELAQNTVHEMPGRMEELPEQTIQELPGRLEELSSFPMATELPGHAQIGQA